ncbi:MAG: hypothetical protein UX20_C0001G0001, partial [Candidatus Magasanikbacteria bacterium GW2011_GWC2_45_8]
CLENYKTHSPENKELAKRVLESGGAIISEYGPGETIEKKLLQDYNIIEEEKHEEKLSMKVYSGESIPHFFSCHLVQRFLLLFCTTLKRTKMNPLPFPLPQPLKFFLYVSSSYRA